MHRDWLVMPHQTTKVAVATLLSLFAAGCDDAGTFKKRDWPAQGAIKSQSFAPRIAGDSNEPRFTLIPHDQTGIDFVIRWDKSDQYNRVFFSQNSGGGACVGDYDRDGNPDIYLTRPSGGNRLYRNLGDFRFADVTIEAGVDDAEYWGTGASFVDINNDGWLDIYVCGYDMPNRLYVNRGDGKFSEQAKEFGLDFRGASVMMAFADYDCDGDLDGYLVTAGIPPRADQKFQVDFVDGKPVVIDELKEHWQLVYLPGERVKQIEAGQYDRLFRNDGPTRSGAMKFVEVRGEAGIDGTDIGQAALWWDFNGDRWPDLFVANDYWGPDRLYRNNQDGTFTDVALEYLPHTPWSSMGTDYGDLNGDGRLDLIATDMAGSDHFKQKVGMGNMSDRAWFLDYAEPRQYMWNSVYINTGMNRFLEAAHLTGLDATDWTWSPRIEDLDNDGLEDVFVTNGMSRDFTHSDVNRQIEQMAKEGTSDFFKFWMEQDMRKDKNVAVRNKGNLEFENVGSRWNLDRLGVSFGAATGDFDGDGDLDLVVNNMDEPASIYRNDVAVQAAIQVRLQGTRSNDLGLGAEVRVVAGARRQVRFLGLARGWTSSSEPILHFGLGAANSVERLEIYWPSGHVQEFANLDVNQRVTVTEPYAEPPVRAKRKPGDTTPENSPLFARADAIPVVHTEEPYDDYQRQPLLPAKLSQLGPGMAWGDVNQDGYDDMYLAGARGSAGQLLLGAAGNAWHKQEMPAFVQDADKEDLGALFLDFDGDDDLDLYVVSGSSELTPGSPRLQDRLYVNDGKGEFVLAEGKLPPETDSGSVVAAADFDRDGDLDLFVGSRVVPGEFPLAPPSHILRNDNGKYVDQTADVAPGLKNAGLVTSSLWTDVDADGWSDLLVTQEWGPVRYFHNESGRLVEQTEPAGLQAYTGWWNGIAGGDIDHDGDIDYVATNFGLNTKYHASVEFPTQLYYGDFDHSGKMQIVESEYEDGTLFPVRGKSCSTAAMPFLAEKFPTFTDFASADLQKIYNPNDLEKAYHVSATTLESGLFINAGDGRFSFRPLPRLAQIAPSFGVDLCDVDGDQKLDLYLVQNFYSPQRETGRMDGGVSLLLKGDGQGNFEPVWPTKSGLLVPGDAKSLSRVDLNGDQRPDYVVATNNGPMHSFLNQGRSSARWVNVRLRGPVGNSCGYGARVVCRQGDVAQTAEIYAGGGYLSQSAPVLFFAVSEGEPPVTVDVTWPDGTASNYTLDSNLSVHHLSHPSLRSAESPVGVGDPPEKPPQ